MGYGRGGRRIFSDKVEEDLAQHAVNLSARFFGLSCVQTRKLAYNFATLNDIAISLTYQPDSSNYHAFRQENLPVILQR